MSVTLVSNDGGKVVVPIDLALKSSITLRDLATDCSDIDQIDLPSIASKRALEIICFMITGGTTATSCIDEFVDVILGMNYLNMNHNNFFSDFIKDSLKNWKSAFYEKNSSIGAILKQARKRFGIIHCGQVFSDLDERLSQNRGPFPYEDLDLSIEKQNCYDGLLRIPKEIISAYILPALDAYSHYVALLHPLLFQVVLEYQFPKQVLLPQFTRIDIRSTDIFSAWLNSVFLSDSLRTKQDRKAVLILTDNDFRQTPHTQCDNMNICLIALRKHDGFGNMDRAREKRQILSQSIRKRISDQKEKEVTRKRQREEDMADIITAHGFKKEIFQHIFVNFTSTDNLKIIDFFERQAEWMVINGWFKMLALCTTDEKYQACIDKYTPL